LDVESQQQAFEKFERGAVRVPDSDNSEAKRVHPEITGAVKEKLETVIETFLSGSYSRKVQVVRLNDVDAIVVLADPEVRYSGSAKAALEDIRAAAEGCDIVLDTDLGVRAVKLVLRDHEFTVDLVAALEPENGEDGLLLARHLPDEGHDDWQLLNPEGQRKAASAKNGECNGIYVPGVRTVKFWNQGLDKPLRSYHAESILWHALDSPVEYPKLVVKFFDEAYERLAPGATTPDPGAPNADPVDKRLEDWERAAARSRVEDARRIAHEASEKEDLEESLERWADLFGPSFPTSGTSANNLGAALGAGMTGIQGPGVRPGKGREAIKPRSWRKG